MLEQMCCKARFFHRIHTDDFFFLQHKLGEKSFMLIFYGKALEQKTPLVGVMLQNRHVWQVGKQDFL